jgi:hypothetical protein
MTTTKTLCVSAMILGLLASLCGDLFAAEPTREIIDKTNWQKVEGLLPDCVLNWVKKGDFVLNIEKLNYDPVKMFPDFQMKAFKTNLGKYALDAENGIIDVKTGKLPEHVIGLPFPKIDPDDPKLCPKVMYNNHYMQYQPDNLKFPYEGINVGRKSGFERESESLWSQMAMDGNPWAAKRPNSKGFEKFAIALVLKPYDVAGTAVMLWRYMSPKQEDSSFGYIPAIRRVRRMSPANRSDAFMGGDLAMDDANGYDGKVTAFNWKLLRKQEGIIPVLTPDTVLIVKNEEGEWQTTEGIKGVIYGYQVKEGWQGAPWAPTNLVWVKRPMYVIEMTPRDPYYNYGPQELWVDAEKYGAMYKVINDKAGDYWKTMFISSMTCESADKKVRFASLAGQQMVDGRTDHSTIIEDASPRNIWTYRAKMNPYDYTLGGFQKFCK